MFVRILCLTSMHCKGRLFPWMIVLLQFPDFWGQQSRFGEITSGKMNFVRIPNWGQNLQFFTFSPSSLSSAIADSSFQKLASFVCSFVCFNRSLRAETHGSWWDQFWTNAQVRLKACWPIGQGNVKEQIWRYETKEKKTMATLKS